LIVLTAAIHLLMVVIRFAVFVPIHRKLTAKLGTDFETRSERMNF